MTTRTHETLRALRRTGGVLMWMVRRLATLSPAEALPVPHALRRGRAAVVPAPERVPLAALRPIDPLRLALLVLVGAAGLVVVACADYLSRAGGDGAQPLFWGGLLLIVLPIALQLVDADAGRSERVLLAVALGLLLYMVKVLQNPVAFTYGDELLHLSNAGAIARTGGLFPDNPILPVSTYYPGLAAATAALAKATGLGLFPAGLVVVGVARAVLVASLFLVVDRLTTARTAGVAVVVYAAQPNFLFWSAQFSYQSLALPLAMAAAAAFVLRTRDPDGGRRQAWNALALTAILAVVVTHHLTAYALAGLFVVVSLVALLRRRGARASAWGLAAATACASLVWLLQVAPIAQEYLGDILRRSVEGVIDTAGGSSAGRVPFRSSAGTTAALWERALGFASILLLTLALPLGLRRMWGRRGRSVVLPVLAAAALAFLGLLPLRLVPSAWESANRSADFLFVGIGVGVALAGLHLARGGRPGPARTALVAVFVAVTVGGGIVSGWSPDIRLAQPIEVRLGGRAVQPQPFTAANWSRTAIGTGHRFVAGESDGRALLLAGRQRPRVGGDGLARTVLGAETVTPSLVGVMRRAGVQYVAIDRRRISSSTMAGLFFAPAGAPREGAAGLRPAAQVALFDVPSADRLVDTGDVVLYDVRRVRP